MVVCLHLLATAGFFLQYIHRDSLIVSAAGTCFILFRRVAPILYCIANTAGTYTRTYKTIRVVVLYPIAPLTTHVALSIRCWFMFHLNALSNISCAIQNAHTRVRTNRLVAFCVACPHLLQMQPHRVIGAGLCFNVFISFIHTLWFFALVVSQPLVHV